MDLDSVESRLTYYKRVIHNVVENEEEETYILQGVKLFNFKIVNQAVRKHYVETIARLVECMDDRFADVRSYKRGLKMTKFQTLEIRPYVN